MARYAREGVEVTVLTCTGGERGDVLNPRLRHDTTISADLPAVRRIEMARAQQILGVDHEWLGFIGSWSTPRTCCAQAPSLRRSADRPSAPSSSDCAASTAGCANEI